MKFLIALALATPLAQASECFVVSTCVKNVSECAFSKKNPTYSSVFASVSREAQFRYEWKQNIECIHRNGKKSFISQEGSDLMNSKATVKVEELRIPATLEEVNPEYISAVNSQALEKCDEVKQTTILENKICE